jgi:tocopherol O-methyltransferase
MKTLLPIEKKVQHYYDNFWSTKNQRTKQFMSTGFHFGYYERGINSYEQATKNMNNYIGRLLAINNRQPLHIFDAGCGVGATSLYLAAQHPHVFFTGLALAPAEIKLARQNQRKKHIRNARFLVGNYTHTTFPSKSFDGVFALESFEYAANKKNAIQEMYRILIPGGKIVIVDGFLCKDTPSNSFMKKIYSQDLEQRALQQYASIQKMKTYLRTAGFTDIRIQDLSKNIAHYYLSGGMVYGLYYFLRAGIQCKITQRAVNHKKDGMIILE